MDDILVKIFLISLLFVFAGGAIYYGLHATAAESRIWKELVRWRRNRTALEPPEPPPRGRFSEKASSFLEVVPQMAREFSGDGKVSDLPPAPETPEDAVRSSMEAIIDRHMEQAFAEIRKKHGAAPMAVELDISVHHNLSEKYSRGEYTGCSVIAYGD